MSDKSLAINQALGVERLGEIMWKSGYWQDTRSQAQAIVKILAGAELEFGPITSMNGINIIEGKTSLSANLVGAAIQRSGRYRYRVLEHDAKHCIIDFYEIVGGVREKLGTSSFSLDDAKAAGLMGGKSQMWTKYPRNMVFSRALTNGARWYTPDVFGGPVYTPDELGAEVNEAGDAVNVIDVEPYVPTEVREVEDTSVGPNRMVTSADDRVWKRWLEVRSEAEALGANPPNLTLPLGYNQLVSNATLALAGISKRKAQLAAEDAERAAAREARKDREAEPPSGAADAEPLGTQDDSPVPSSLADAWARNRSLMDQMYAAGKKLRELPSKSTLEEVSDRNDELERLVPKG